jgi:inner membrane protein
VARPTIESALCLPKRVRRESSSTCIGLLTFYLSYVLRSVTRGVGFGALLTTLYAAMYELLISEDNALILGSLMLFAVLAVVMAVTRKVDWYKGSSHLMKVATSPPPMQGLGL